LGDPASDFTRRAGWRHDIVIDERTNAITSEGNACQIGGGIADGGLKDCTKSLGRPAVPAGRSDCGFFSKPISYMMSPESGLNFPNFSATVFVLDAVAIRPDYNSSWSPCCSWSRGFRRQTGAAIRSPSLGPVPGTSNVVPAPERTCCPSNRSGNEGAVAYSADGFPDHAPAAAPSQSSMVQFGLWSIPDSRLKSAQEIREFL
jgi:hypothetical protein